VGTSHLTSEWTERLYVRLDEHSLGPLGPHCFIPHLTVWRSLTIACNTGQKLLAEDLEALRHKWDFDRAYDRMPQAKERLQHKLALGEWRSLPHGEESARHSS
jgi:hypothetical protein